MCKPLTVTPLFAIAALLFISAAQPQTPAWKPLFNGKDLTGWKHVGPGNMTVEDGLIRTHGGMGLLYWTGGKLSNCRIRVVYKMRDFNDNSGDRKSTRLNSSHSQISYTGFRLNTK